MAEAVMLTGHTFEGWEARLRPRGFGRFSGAGFLFVWLCGWIVGEIVVACVLCWGAWSLITGQPPRDGAAPLEVGPALFVGALLCVWLAGWTVGGIVALNEFLTLIWSGDRLIATSGGLVVRRRVGPFVRRISYPRESLRAIYAQPSGRALMAETESGSVELTRFGSDEERLLLVRRLTRELRLPDDSKLAPRLPDAWREIVTADNTRVMVRRPRDRRILARVVGVIALLFTTAAVALVADAVESPDRWAFACIAFAPAALAVWGVIRLALGRDEWLVGKGQLVLQRRFRDSVSRRFDAGSLELLETTDGDGDTAFELVALGRRAGASASSRGKDSPRVITRDAFDAVEPRRVGAWLASRTGLPLVDRITPEA